MLIYIHFLAIKNIVIRIIFEKSLRNHKQSIHNYAYVKASTFFSQLLWLNSRMFYFLRFEFLNDLNKLLILWHMCANSNLQFTQLLIAYGLLIKTDESIFT